MFNVQPFKETIERFAAGEIDTKVYKGISGGYGTYAQRGGKAHMIRLRLPGGDISPKQLRFIADMVKKHGIELIHTTTCQTVQLHNLAPEAVCDIMEKAQEVGIFTKGGGGDHPRNVMATPLSGVRKDEYFDVMPYAKAATEYLLRLDDDIKMPRKLKVAFSSVPESNEVHATFRDLGFVAREDGGFDVYSAGGLGNAPKLGLLTAEAVDPADTLTYIRAMVLTFLENGNYEVRAKARTRFMRDTLGDEGYLEAFNRNLEKAKAENLPKITPEPSAAKTGIRGELSDPRITEQKQDGLYSVLYKPAGGNAAPAVIEKLAAAAEKADVNLRLIPGEGMYIINCTAPEAEEFLAITSDSGTTPIEMSTSCIGSGICQIGLQNSQKLLGEILSAVKAAKVSANSLPPVRISGCTSSCGAHQTNTIGFQGRMKKDADGKAQPAFAVFTGGCELGGGRLGSNTAVVFASDIPEMLVEIARAADASGLDYYSWRTRFPDAMERIIEKYN